VEGEVLELLGHHLPCRGVLKVAVCVVPMLGLWQLIPMLTMASILQPFQLSANQIAHPPFVPSSSGTQGNFIVPSYPVSSVSSIKPPSTTSGYTNMTFDWHSDLNVPCTLTSFTPPTAPHQESYKVSNPSEIV